MENDKIKKAFDSIYPEEEQKEKMLSDILKEVKETETLKNKSKFSKVITSTSLAAVLVLGIVVLPRFFKTNGPSDDIIIEPSISEADTSSPLPPPPAASPMGMRKFMNYKNCRYAFLNNGEEFNLNEDDLLEKTGTLTLSIAASPSENGSSNFATTFALGGDVYKLRNYDPAFRIAVLKDGKYYIAENVDTLDGSDIDMQKFFDTAGFPKNIVSMDIYDHFEREVLDTLNENDIYKFTSLLACSKPAELKDEDYQKIGTAQSSGESFLVSMNLNDNTSYRLYVIPSLNLAMIGDNKYYLPSDFEFAMGEYFKSLDQKPSNIQY